MTTLDATVLQTSINDTIKRMHEAMEYGCLRLTITPKPWDEEGGWLLESDSKVGDDV